MFLMLLSIFPNFGYSAKARTSVEAKDVLGWWYVIADCNITFNPFLYPFSWLIGSGRFSGSHRFVSMPIWTGGEFPHPAPRTPKDLEGEAIMSLVLSQVNINIIYNFIVLLTIKLLKMQDLYFCLIAGIAGFPIGGLMGALSGFLIGLSVIAFIMLRSRKGNGISAKILKYIFEKYEI